LLLLDLILGGHAPVPSGSTHRKVYEYRQTVKWSRLAVPFYAPSCK
jgi:hypothetical protein